MTHNKPNITKPHQTETTVQNTIRCELSVYGICIRLQSGVFKGADNRSVKCGFTGLSDLLFLSRDGKAYFFEVKTKTGRASPEQINFIETVKKMGFGAGVVRSTQDCLDIIKNGENNLK